MSDRVDGSFRTARDHVGERRLSTIPLDSHGAASNCRLVLARYLYGTARALAIYFSREPMGIVLDLGQKFANGLLCWVYLLASILCNDANQIADPRVPAMRCVRVYDFPRFGKAKHF